ncbi:nucleotidyltransferase domain-containing protein [Candidatus Woesearchaeota archaeon]|nr:nucleotidyltransferase domain-containing protein [Candidatus Woesearchaeota archaeon]
MKRILDALRKRENDKGFRIVFAVESGSREWGMASRDSDYDVRGVFCYPPEKYYDLSQYAEDFTVMKGDIDIHLKEIRKFTTLLLNSNPTCIEWLQSRTWYIGSMPAVFRQFLKNDWNPTSLAHHYVGLAKQNYLKYLKTRNEPTVKRYLYACRGWLAGKIALSGKLPPISVPKLVEEAPVAAAQKKRLRELIAAKQHGTEHMLAGQLPEFDAWLEKVIQAPIPPGPRKRVNIDAFRKFVREEIEK